MTDIYNLTNFTASNTVIDYAESIDQLTGGFFWPFMLALTLLIAFAALKNYTFMKAALASTFIVAVLTGVLFVSGLVSQGVLTAYFALFLMALFGDLMSS